MVNASFINTYNSMDLKMKITLANTDYQSEDFQQLDPALPVVTQVDLKAWKRVRVEELKTETSKRVQTFNGKYHNDIEWFRKSQNYQDLKIAHTIKMLSGQILTADEMMLYNLAVEIINRKDANVKRCNEIEESINFLTLEELLTFDITDDQHWFGIGEKAE